jgi:hypothetical protein
MVIMEKQIGHLNDKDFSWNNRDQVMIKNSGLINALIGDTSEAIDALSSISPISLSNIFVDDFGTVIVTDPEFKRKIESSILGGPGGLDGVNVGCPTFNIICGKFLDAETQPE